MILPSVISQEMLIFKANYLLPKKKNMNSYVGDILLLVQIPLALAFTSVHYFLNQLIDFDQTGIDTLLRGVEEMIRFWSPLKCLTGYWQYENMSSSPPLLRILLLKTKHIVCNYLVNTPPTFNYYIYQIKLNLIIVLKSY